MNRFVPSWQSVAVLTPAVFAALLLTSSLRQPALNEVYFINGTYYVLWLLLALVLWTRIASWKASGRPSIPDWCREHAGGIACASIITAVAVLAVPAAFRVLADETNLVGVSKNLYLNKTADFVLTLKRYYENNWNLSSVTDRRPALFPFMVSLLHVVRGYRVDNAFWFNAGVLWLTVFLAYRLAKSLGGPLFGIASAILVAAHPITLVAARSAGFDVMAACAALLVVKSFYDHSKAPSAETLAVVIADLCLLVHVRYEGWGLFLAALIALFFLELVRWEWVRPFGLLYSCVPLILLPRVWQSILKAHDSEQPLSTALFSRKYVSENLYAYFDVLKKPLDFQAPHTHLLIALGVAGFVLAVAGVLPTLWRRTASPHVIRFLLFVGGWVLVQAVVIFTYNWGKPLHPASARLFVGMDILVSMLAAYLIVWLLRPFPRWIVVVVCAGFFAAVVGPAAEGRFINQLMLTRQLNGTLRYFDRLGEKNILIVSDRPGMYTVMDYGAMDVDAAKANRGLLEELSRTLYKDIYIIQEVDLATHKPTAKFDVWPDREKETVDEFQNAENGSIRIVRVKKVMTP